MAAPGQLEHEQLFSDVSDLIKEYLLKYQERSSKVDRYICACMRVL